MPNKITDLPDVDFVDLDIDKLLQKSILDYEEAYFLQYGVRKKLYPGDPIRIFLYTQALREYQLRVLINDGIKSNLIKFSKGDKLKNLVAITRTFALEAKPAKATQKFILDPLRPQGVKIEKGTLLTPGNGVFFMTSNDLACEADEIIGEIICTEAGTIGNGFVVGQIDSLVRGISWIKSTHNITVSFGGEEAESDENLKERAILAPREASVAGHEETYISVMKKYSAQIADVKVSCEESPFVDILILLKNGNLPDDAFIASAQEYISDKRRRPLTDRPIVKKPKSIEYDINTTVYLSKVSDESKQAISEGIEEYKVWQQSKIGRTINPSELILILRNKGAINVIVNSPNQQILNADEIAVCRSVDVTFLEGTA